MATGPQHIWVHSYNLGLQCKVFDVESHAICEGLHLLPDYPKTYLAMIYICTDNQSLIQTLTCNDLNHQFACDALNQAHDLHINGWNLRTVWTPSHCNIPGNKLADTLAKAGVHAQILCPATIMTET